MLIPQAAARGVLLLKAVLEDRERFHGPGCPCRADSQSEGNDGDDNDMPIAARAQRLELHRLDAGGTVPGCFPTREAVNSAGTPVYVINGFDYQEGLVDARPDGGSLWRIRYGLVSLPAAVRVADTVSGRAAPVTKGGLFMLAIPDAHPEAATSFQLVAYDDAGKIVGQD